MNSMDLISVIIPVYNTAEFLSRCLDSILNNSYHNLEVICVNDGSTDNSAQILSEYEEKDPRVIIINQKNAGVSAARNAGLDLARGKFVTFVDSDDWIHRSFFEVLHNGILANNASVAVCKAYDTNRFVKDSDVTDAETIFRFFSTSQVLSDEVVRGKIWGRLYRKELIGNHRFELGMKLAEDAVFNLDVLFSVDNVKIVVCNTYLYYYFIRWESAVHTLSGNELKPVISWFLDHADGTTMEISGIYTCEALKRVFAWRYFARMAGLRKELLQIKVLKRTAIKSLKANTTISAKKKFVYTLFSAVPLCYRLFRRLKDPTLLNWEKRMRADRCNRRNNKT